MLTVTILPDRQAEAKLACVVELGPDTCACIGDGRNDRLMLEDAALGMVLVQAEGAAPEALLAADVASCSIMDALALLCRPLRLTATLGS